jgi:predicted small metal-binding protein
MGDVVSHASAHGMSNLSEDALAAIQSESAVAA